ncbi:S-adenosylmethionine decarboxylase proenzyme-like [Wolffia australiana]
MAIPEQNPPPQSAIGFEGYEKRIEITFSEAPLFKDPHGHGLRALSRPEIDSILDTAFCTIVDHLSNKEFDSYVLSESSLFIYPYKIILKTCGTTKLLLAIPRILELSAGLGLAIAAAKYSRGTFIFPEAQPAPHRCFSEEVSILDSYFPGLVSGAYLLGDAAAPDRNWHIYYASKQPEQPPMVTLEMCMTGLEKHCASVFFKNSDSTGKMMTKMAGIQEIIPEMELCDFEFEPCGYSMNGIAGGALSTIHVTPEEGFSYASYEAMGFDPGSLDFGALASRVLKCFGPACFSVAVTVGGGRAGAASWGGRIAVKGYQAAEYLEQLLPGGALVIYQTFIRCPESPKSVLHCWETEAGGKFGKSRMAVPVDAQDL